MVNKVILIGNLGGDPEVRRLENGAVVAKFSVATNESYKDKAGEFQTITEWHDVVAWRFLAERAEKYLKKGSTVYVEGKLTHRKWEDSEGKKRKTTEVVANNFRMIGKRDDQAGGGNFPPNEYPSQNPSASSNTSTAPAPSNTEPAADDDLPF